MVAGDVYNQKVIERAVSPDDDTPSATYIITYNGFCPINSDPVEANIVGDSIDLRNRGTYEGQQRSSIRSRSSGTTVW